MKILNRIDFTCKMRTESPNEQLFCYIDIFGIICDEHGFLLVNNFSCNLKKNLSSFYLLISQL